MVAPCDIVSQTRYIYEKFAKLLAAAGAGLEHIVEATYVERFSNRRIPPPPA